MLAKHQEILFKVLFFPQFMPFDPSKYSNEEIMNLVIYGHIRKGMRSILRGPFGVFPCNMCRWQAWDFDHSEAEIVSLLYWFGIGRLCQWCQITLFWELKKRNLGLEIGKVVYDF